MIRCAKILEIPDILRITKACTHHMESLGIYQWNDTYPDAETFRKDIARGELFILEVAPEPVGLVVLTSLKDREYENVEWLTNEENSLYVHRLAVHPDFQGMGYARQLMDFAESLGRKKGARSIRLDTFSQNPKNQRFYELRGYIRLGDIYFPNQSVHPFHCYELIL